MVSPARAGRATPERADNIPPELESRAGVSFPIAGIGASAGGLEAFTALLKHLPIDTGMGFVLVQHLDPQHESALTQLLGRATTMPVQEVTNKLRVEPNHVYVIPRNTNLGIVGGVLTLRPRPKTRAPHRSIDFFLEALAADQRELAIGVILSGTATDGTVGLEAIKAEGGITFAQDDSARYDSMPRSAVAAGCVDFVLLPEHIAREIARIAKHPHMASAAAEGLTRAEDDRASATAHEDDDTPLHPTAQTPRGGDPGLPSGGHGDADSGATRARAEAAGDRVEDAGRRIAEDGLKKIMLLLRNHSGVDFSLYKSNTIQRRITRRMVLTKHDTHERYAQFLRGNSHELDALYSDVLISVTSFFRSPDAFDVLQRKVLPTLLQQRGDAPLRFWVLGCSTGQEAYSMAMAFVEAAEKAPRMRSLQVFATDLNEALLDKARHGLYARSIAQDLSPERLRRFFVEEEGGYRVNKALREIVVFARQNVISDPPFSRLDLISCRNLLIYFEPALQKKVFPVFHYALKPGGFLYLGASESIGGFTELFEPVDKKHKIYARKATATPAFQLPARKERGEPRTGDARLTGSPRIPEEQGGGAVDGFRAELSAQREADRVSVNQFAPPAVLISADLQVLQFRGPTGAYLEPPTGKATLDVLKMARNGLMLPLRAAINQAKKENKSVRKDDVRVEQDGTVRTVSVQVIPLKNLRERCFLIVFEDATKAGPAPPATGVERGPRQESQAARAQTDRAGASRRIAELEAELAETRDYLQSLQEQHEAANEELQASNEEVQSANEELQSINEELETSKEELESANEELTTVNEEMANRNAELNRLNSDLLNVQTSAHVAMVLLARNLTVRRFSAQAEKQFNLLATDVGRPIGSVRLPLDLPDLERLVTDVIDTVRAHEREVQDKDGRWFSLRVRPYLTIDNKVDGAVLVLVDIDALKRSEQIIAAARDYADNIVATVHEPLLVLDAKLRVERANRAFYETFGVTAADTLGKFVYDLGNRQWDIPELRRLLSTILPEQQTIDDFSVEHAFERLGHRVMVLNARPMHDPDHGAELILLAFEDVTERRRSDTLIDEHRRVLELIASGKPVERCLDELCRGIERIDARVRACVLLTSEEGTGFSLIVAPSFPGLHDAIHTLPIGDGWAGTCAQAIVSGAAVTCADVAADAGWQNEWKTLNLTDDVRAVYSAPVVMGDSGPQGCMFLCFDEPKEPTASDLRLAGMATDVVASALRRDRSDEALREREARYRSLTQAVTSVIWTTSADGRFVSVQQPWSEYTGQTWEEHRDWGWLNALHPDDRAQIRALWEAALVARTVYQSAGRVWHAGAATYRHFEARGVPVRNADGSVREWVGQCLDVEDRVHADEARARLAALVESSEDAIVSTDLDGIITSWNAGAERLFGYTPQEAVEHPVTLLIPQERYDEETFILERIRRSEAVESFDTVRRRKDGALLDVSVTVSPIRDSHGRVVGASKIARDITERTHADQVMREADRHKNEFLAMLAHELRNPLAPILVSIEIMRRARRTEVSDQERLDLSPRVDHALDVLQRQVAQMVRLVEDLLDAGRISRGKIDLRRERVELSSIVQHAVDAARPLTERRRQQLTVLLPTVPVYLSADPTRLAQIVGNLLNNACKFTDRGGHIWLTVERSEESGPGDGEGTPNRLAPEIVIRVRDSGIGIAADRLEGIFDMFTQIDVSLERSVAGLGIGLTLVKTLAEMHGGTVEATSPGVGYGSEFIVRLPIVIDAPLPAPTTTIDATVAPLRILIVDDNRDSADMLAMLLKFNGHETHTAHDGLAAVEATNRLDPDVVVLDIGLPGLNGYDAARRIREQNGGKGRPLLVALTGWGQDEDRRRSEEAGFDAHLVKPVDERVLRKLLAELGP
jgi:two-component system, chemotaxis family, CheB/CheR fusion protein